MKSPYNKGKNGKSDRDKKSPHDPLLKSTPELVEALDLQGHKIYLAFSTIVRLHSEKDIVKLFTNDASHSQLTCRHSLRQCMKLLPTDRFVQVYRNDIVNRDFIEVVDIRHREVLLKNSYTVKASRRFLRRWHPPIVRL